MALRLNETFLELEVATVERCGQVVRLEHDRVIAHIVVEVD